MKITVTVTAGDFIRMQIRSLFRFPSIAIIGIVLVLIAVSNFDVYQKYGLPVFIIFLMFFSFSFLAISIIMQLVIAFIMLKIKDQKSFICDHDFEFEEEYFIEKTEFNESRYPWTAVSKYNITKGFYYIYISSSQVHIIPKRTLTGSETGELDRLLKEKTGK